MRMHMKLTSVMPALVTPYVSGYTDDDIDDVIWNLNSTPRKCLGYRTPIEAFAVNFGVALEM